MYVCKKLISLPILYSLKQTCHNNDDDHQYYKTRLSVGFNNGCTICPHILVQVAALSRAM